MHDLGMVFENNTNSYILGSFYENQVETIYHKGEDFPHLLISKTFIFLKNNGIFRKNQKQNSYDEPKFH